MAGRALRPVDTITLAAQRIAGGDLTQRLTVPASADEIGRLTNTFNAMIDRLETSFGRSASSAAMPRTNCARR